MQAERNTREHISRNIQIRVCDKTVNKRKRISRTRCKVKEGYCLTVTQRGLHCCPVVSPWGKINLNKVRELP